jgi:hypothetical protein
MLPRTNEVGDLSPGVYPVTLDELIGRFGSGSEQRRLVTRRLLHIHNLARRTGHLDRMVVFGSYVTNKPAPNDVDIILVMEDNFRVESCPIEAKGLFDHSTAQARYGVSIFWVRPGLLIGETIEEFVSYWQIKRDGSKRGIVEVISR